MMVSESSGKKGCRLLLDVQMGVAGDMLLGALLDLAEELNIIQVEELTHILESAALPMENVRVEIKDILVSGISAKGTWVLRDNIHTKEEVHSNISGKRMHEFLKNGCKNVGLSGEGAEFAFGVLHNILRAEGKVHRRDCSALHLHETGAPDTLVEIIGCAYIMELFRQKGFLDPGKGSILATPVSVGSGSVEISHGIVPVPAPATMELLKGMEYRYGPRTGELATPTGVSLLGEMNPVFVRDHDDIVISPLVTGCGLGKRKYGGRFVNVVRAIYIGL